MERAKTPGQALLNAAALIEQNGWCQGAWRRDEAHCAMSAIYHAVGESHRKANRVVRDAEDAVSDLVCGRGFLTIWNDGEGRTKKEVVEALRTASEAA